MSLRIMDAAMALIVFAFAMEATCRIDDRIRYGVPLLSPVTSEADLLIRDSTGEHARPRARFEKWAINNIGMRGPDAPAAKPPATLRVVTAGASETFGLYESPDQEFPRQLEDSLNARLDGSGCVNAHVRHAEVLNAAAAGMSLPTIEQDLRLRIRPLRPDVVVLYPTPVQYLLDFMPGAAPPDSTGDDARLPFVHVLEPRAADRVYAQFKQLMPGWFLMWLRHQEIDRKVRQHPAGWRFQGIPEDRLAAYDTMLRHVIGTVRAEGAVPVLATHANAFDGGHGDAARLVSWETQYPRADGALLLAFDSVAAGVTIQAARDSSVALVDLERTLREHGTPLFADYAHFTDAGAAAVAGALAPTVLAAVGLDVSCADHASPVRAAVQ